MNFGKKIVLKEKAQKFKIEEWDCPLVKEKSPINLGDFLFILF